jgi:hypothetical protein
LKIIVAQQDVQGEATAALIQHNGQELCCNIALFDRSSYTGRYDLFEHINKYWAQLPVEKQTEIFRLYEEIKNVFDAYPPISELARQLYPLINRLTALHDLEAMRHWVQYYSDIIIPSAIEENFVESQESSVTRIKTYLRKDYESLVVLTMALRVMIPIWGEYIAVTKSEYGTAFKEYYAYGLLAESSYEHSPAMEKLKEYIAHNIPNEKDRPKPSAIIGGVSSEDFPRWILGLVVVRKLCAGDIRGVDPSGHLVSAVWSYVSTKVKTLENNFIGNVRSKITEESVSENDNNKLSRLEGYKNKQDVPQGPLMAINEFLRHPAKVALKICPDLDLNLLKESLRSVKQLENQISWKPQTILVQWVMSKATPPKAMMKTSKIMNLNAFAIAQAILWHKKHYELAAFITAISVPQVDSSLITSSDSRARIPKDHLEILDEYYPFSRKPTGKKRVYIRSNVAVENINLVAMLLNEHDWRITLPNAWAEQLTGSKMTRRLAIPHDIKIKLSTLAIEIATRRF